MGLRNATTTPDVYEAIKPKKDCRIEILNAEMGKSWKHKVTAPGDYKVPGETRVMKLTINITDEAVETENSDAKPRRKLDDMVILEPHPYVDKDGAQRFMKLEKLFQLQQFLGFEPRFVNKFGQEVDPHITKTGRKVCPKDASIAFQPAFLDAYFDANEEPRFDAWMSLEGVASIGLKKQSEEETLQYGAKNEVTSYAPQA